MAHYFSKQKRLLIAMLWLISASVNAQLIPSFVGDASDQGDDCYIITPDLTTQAGAVWYDNPIDLTTSFTIQFDADFGNKDSNGADGMVIAFKDSATPEIGDEGSGLSYAGLSGASIAVEFDTYTNGGILDPSEDHTAIISNGSTSHSAATNLAGPIQTSATSTNIEDGLEHAIEVSWDVDTQTLSVFFDCEERLAYTGDIVNDIFSGNPTVYFGFTGSTGALSNLHQICFKYISFVEDFLTIDDRDICVGESVDDIDATVLVGVNYQWSPTTGVSNPGIPNPVFTPTVATEYTVTITDDCGNSFDESFTIAIIPDLVVEINTSNPLCFGGTGRASLIIAGGRPPYTQDWGGIDPDNVPAGTYSVQVNDLDCYEVTLTYTITQPTALEAEITTVDALCFEGRGSASIEVSGATAPYTIDWQGNDPNALLAGDYSYTVSDANACTLEGNYTIGEASELDIDVVFEQLDCDHIIGSAITNVSGGTPPYEINWFGYDTENLRPGKYLVGVVDANDCEYREQFVYEAIELKVFFPTAFTPNRDGLNDVFIPVVDCYTSFEFSVYDRWGKLLYESDPSELGWDGTFDGEILQNGVYVYKVKVVDAAFRITEYNGQVSLIR